ncbi:MAG TPA: hypothetical protein VEU47_02255 [Candidatus Cybelea sp.]|nr:hypothetical protein [Candidatus Cybelea sp.]
MLDQAGRKATRILSGFNRSSTNNRSFDLRQATSTFTARKRGRVDYAALIGRKNPLSSMWVRG